MSFSSTPQPVSTSAFLESITSGISRENVPPDVRPAKAKVVKRVRVLSPPPSSPSSPESVQSRGFGRHDDSSDDASDEDDQFSKRFPELPDGLDEAAPLRLANTSSNTTPDNPFGRTLRDIEGLTDGKTSSGGAGKSLDVNAFKMLLLTGKAVAVSSAQKPQSQGGTAAEATHTSGPDASYAADLETPRSSSDIADRGITLASPPSKRKPPPPSSRHGRKISIQTPELPHISSGTASPISPSDVNKPLPPAPSFPGGEGTEDVFAREAAGKVPEQESPTTTGSTPTPALPAPGKKPTPAPPPRRGHARSQSLTASAGVNVPSTAGAESDTPPRSSLESQRSRSESFRSINVPAPPPPPRRPHAPHRQSLGLASPSTASFNAASPDADNPAPESTPPKISPPPPPPARNTSTRRPPSVRSIEATSRKTSGGKESAPPPPPPRQRGSSRGSTDGFGGVRRPSLDSTRGFSTNVPEEPRAEDSEHDFVADPGKGADILADLDALQREVDALRAQQGI